jgi:hypothetical protein
VDRIDEPSSQSSEVREGPATSQAPAEQATPSPEPPKVSPNAEAAPEAEVPPAAEAAPEAELPSPVGWPTPPQDAYATYFSGPSREPVPAERTNRQKWLDRLPAIIVFAVVYLILILIYRPNLMLSQTTTSGGDMGAHHYPAKFMLDYLLPHLKLTGWTMQWFAGMPMFTFYTTVPFLLIALLAHLIPYTIAFKLITALGVFLLPVCMWAFGKLLRLPKPFPILAPIFALGFLTMDSYSIYGGNILSTLAGEFGYSISFALTFLFLGTLYRGLERDKFDWLFAVNGLLLMMIVLTHIVTPIALVIFAPSLLLLFRRWRAVGYMAAVFALGFSLTAFWGVPFLDKISWTASVDWIPLKLLKDLLPGEIRPFAAVGVLGIAYAIAKRDKSTIPMFWIVIAVVILFFTLPKGRLWNGRLLPFLYLTIFMWAAYAAAWLVRPFVVMVRDLLAAPPSLSRRFYAPVLAIVLGITAAVGGATAFGWTQWNYSGYEAKAPWPYYEALNQYIASLPPGRFMWEHNPDLDKFGTPRIFELIPYWTDQPTMEGTLMESAFTAPYHFINQAEVSNRPSNAIGGVDYPPFNMKDGITHLQFMNVPYLITSSPEATDAAAADPRADLLTKQDVVSIFRISGTDGYVEVMKNKPLRVKTDNWKSVAVPWYKDVNNLDVPIVWDRGEAGLKQFDVITPEQAANPPAEPINSEGQVISESVKDEKITFETTAIGVPHWIKVSYFPNWHVQGADGPYVVSPSFMMVIPRQRVVTLTYGSTASNNVGQLLTLIGFLVVIVVLLRDLVPRATAAVARRRENRRQGPTG